MPQIQLQRHGITHNINVRCQHRYATYQAQLTNSFNTIIDLSRQPGNINLAGALQDQRLFQELANRLDFFVVPGVAFDLQNRTGSGRLNAKPGDNLFEWLDPNAAPMPSAQQIFEPIPQTTNYFQLGPNHLSNNKQTSQTAYQTYAEHYVADDVPGFFNRNPLCQHAVRTVANNFTNNLQTFATHLVQDWNDVNTCFFGGNAQRLQTIRTTGSDYHKGGKQVLILTFQVNGNGPNKLIYKPSDIEIDCRLVGDIAGVQNQLPHGLQITNSFAELINQFLNDDCPLQTYKILPRNPGSLLQANLNGTVPIRDSYGYIEYLNHIPERPDDNHASDVKTLTQAGNVPIPEIANSDWITTAPDDARKYWQTTGKLLAMLIVCGCTDIHGQNFRIHKKKPQVIDLEEAFKERHKTIKDVFSGFDTLDRVDDPGTKEPEVDRDQSLTVSPTYTTTGQGFLLNKLVVRQAHQAPVIAKRTAYIEPLAKGFIETMYVLREANNNQSIINWLTEARNMIVRHVTISTTQFAKEMRRTLFRVPNRCPQNAQDFVNFYDCYQNSKPKWFIQLFLQDSSEGYITRFNKDIEAATDSELAWKRLPRFAIFHPEHSFHDYFNVDVPSYYHRLNDAHLLNSRGMRVIPRDTWNWWEQNVFTPNVKPRPALEATTGRNRRVQFPGITVYDSADTFITFFPDTPYNLFQQIFTELNTSDASTFQQFILDNITYLGRGNTQNITVEADDYTDYILPANGQPRVSYTPPGVEAALSLSRASEFQTPSDEQSVLLNGMKVLFNRSAPVYPVNLVHKDKLPPKRHPKKVKPQRY